MDASDARTILDYLPSDRRRDGLWTTKFGYFMLWFEFLALSPSYELARRHRAGKLTEADQARLPSDFDRVLSVFDDLGDVQRQLFLPWWRNQGFEHFGYQGSAPRVTRVGILSSKKKKSPSMGPLGDRYIKGAWEHQGKQETLIVAIPVGLTKTVITRQINSMLKRIDEDKKTLKPALAKYQLVGKRHHKDTLLRYLRVAFVKSAAPKATLWQIGARTKVSATYSSELDFFQKLPRGEATYDRSMLSILTSRALNRARMLSENAARGVFPSYAPCPNALEFDWQETYKLVSSRVRWKKKENARIFGQAKSTV
jgi:hypothetical protein